MDQSNHRTIKVLITLLCLFMGSCSFARDEKEISANLKNDLQVAFGEKSAEHQAAMIELGQWQAKLNEFLFAADDDFSQAMVLAAKISAVGFQKFSAELHKKTDQLDQINDLSYQPIADLLNLMITKPKLSPEAFNVLTGLCSHNELVDYCHANVLVQKRIEQDGDNLHTYFLTLTQAIESNKTNDIEQVLQQMANSTHSYVPIYITKKMAALIDEFIASNPIPQSTINSMIADYQLISGISAEMKAQLETLMPAYMPSFIKANYYYLGAIPNYRILMDYCENHANAFDSCEAIAQILKEKSNVMLDKMIGHKLLVLAHEATANQVNITTAQQLNDQFRADYECIVDLLHGDHFIDNHFDSEFQAITHNATDEYQMMQDHAQLRYSNLTAQGDTNAINPESCFTNNVVKQQYKQPQ